MKKINFPPNLRDEVYFGVSSNELLNIDICGRKPRKDAPEYTRRPNGRLDWQIIYICDGYAYFQFENSVHRLGPYSLVIFPPHTPQYYAYYPKECPVAYFVHFSGSIIDDLMKKFNLLGEKYYSISESYNTETVNKILNFQNKFALNSNNESACWGLFIDLLSHFSNIINENGFINEKTARYDSNLSNIAEDIHSNFVSNYSVKDYADKIHLSESYFAHIFKIKYGVSPIQYRNTVRINHAKILLLNSPKSIEDIALESGFGNISVFSKKFKEITGYSPSAFRKKHLK